MANKTKTKNGICPTCNGGFGLPGASGCPQCDETQREAEDTEWFDAACVAITVISASCRTFTSDDVWGYLKDWHPQTSVSEPKSMGSVFRWARKKGIASTTDRYRPTKRRASHGRPVRVWRGVA